MTKDLLQLRKDMNVKKPAFVVKESNFAPKVKVRWRFPRGRHSKVRQMHCGRPAMPNPGYGAPAEVRGLHASGLEMVVVYNAEQLQKVNPKIQGAIIGASVGTRKRLSLLEMAQQKKITLLNVKDASSTAKKILSAFEERKELRKRKVVEMTKKEEQKKKKAEERAQKEKEEKNKAEQSEVSAAAEVHAKQEHEMMEKTITKRQ